MTLGEKRGQNFVDDVDLADDDLGDFGADRVTCLGKRGDGFGISGGFGD